MNTASVGLAFAAGTLAAVNPCGFALLPAYLTLFISGGNAPDAPDPRARPGGPGQALRRAAIATAAMTGGFVVVFGAFALAVTPFALSVERWLPWATVVIGAGLMGLGAWMLAGRALTVAGPKIKGRSDPTRSAPAMGAYGVSFAVASLSCTIGPFLAVTTTAFRDGSLSGVVAVFVAYAAGMGTVVGTLTLAVALSREALIQRLRTLLPYVTRVGGGLLLLAGAYAAYYGWYEIRILSGDRVEDPIIDTAVGWQSEISRAIAGLELAHFAAALAVLAAAAWVMGRVRSRARSRSSQPERAQKPGEESAAESR